MATSTDQIKLVKRYTNALFELAADRKKQAEVSKDLGSLHAALAASDALVSTLNNPTLNATALGNAVNALAKKAKLGKTITEFLNVLVANKRLGLLADVITHYNVLSQAERGESVVQIASATKLAKKDKDAITKSLGGKVTLEESVDGDLLAGFTLKSGSRMLDASLKGKLDRMKTHLTSN